MQVEKCDKKSDVMTVIGTDIVSKIAQSAKIVGLKGSTEKREALASRLNAKLYVMINDTFKKRAVNGEEEFITKEELKKHFFAICPNNNIFVDLQKVSDGNQTGYIEKLFKRSESTLPGAVAGISVHLPFKDMNGILVIGQDQIEIIMHEFRHVFDHITKPKIMVDDFDLVRLEKFNSAGKFYKKFLDNAETKYVESDDADLKLKREINNYFESQQISLSDKITILNHWRSYLRSEKISYKDGFYYDIKAYFKNLRNWIKAGNDVLIEDIKFNSANFATKKEKQVALSKSKSNYFTLVHRENVNDKYRFEEKIKVIEEILKNTITEKRSMLKQKKTIAESV